MTLEFHRIWIEQREAARGIEEEFGTQRALAYMIGEKFINFLEASDAKPEFRAELLAFVAFILPGIVATSWMVTTASNGSLAQGLLARFGASWRPSPDLAALGLPMWIPVLLAFASGATLLGGTARFIGVNVLIVLAVPFCLAGLAVLHTVARRFPRPAVTLTVFYLLAGVLGWPSS